MALKIEKGVPLPAAVASRSEYAELIDGMKPGDSVLFPKEDAAQRFKLALAYRQRDGIHGTAVRKEAKGWRVWLTPKKRGAK